MKVITIASLKGGVGKTTVTANLAGALCSTGARVLAIDLDANNNLTDFYVGTNDELAGHVETMNAYYWLNGSTPIAECALGAYFDLDGSKIYFVAAIPQLHRIGAECGGNPTGIMRIKKELKKLEKDYDYILIDCPPSLSYELRCGLFAADQVVIPIQPSRWGFAALGVMLGEIAEAADINPGAANVLLLPSAVTQSTAGKLQQTDFSEMPCAPKVAKTFIRKWSGYGRASDSGASIKHGTKGEEDFSALAQEVR